MEQHGYAPTIEEIGLRMGLSSTATVYRHLKNLEAKRYLKRTTNRARSIELTTPDDKSEPSVEVPLMGYISAGEPLEAIEQRDTITIPERMVPERGKVYVLMVRGDSMMEDHILDRDYVIVKSQETAGPGDTVVALLGDGEAVIKKFFVDDKEKAIRLEPRKQGLKPIIVREGELKILGVVIGLIREF